MRYLDEYKARIEEGTDVVGKWVKKNIAMVENGLANGDFYYDEARADRAIRFIEHFCHHYEGRTDLITLDT